MIVGAHVVIASTDPEADYALFRDVLNLSAVDAVSGWFGPDQTAGVDSIKRPGGSAMKFRIENVQSRVYVDTDRLVGIGGAGAAMSSARLAPDRVPLLYGEEIFEEESV